VVYRIYLSSQVDGDFWNRSNSKSFVSNTVPEVGDLIAYRSEYEWFSCEVTKREFVVDNQYKNKDSHQIVCLAYRIIKNII